MAAHSEQIPDDLPDRLIGDNDSALGEKILDIPETEAKAMISQTA